MARNPWRDPRDRAANPYVSEAEQEKFWESEYARAERMPHIGPRRAQQAIAWMQKTPSWSLEDYDEYYADLQRCALCPSVACESSRAASADKLIGCSAAAHAALVNAAGSCALHSSSGRAAHVMSS